MVSVTNGRPVTYRRYSIGTFVFTLALALVASCRSPSPTSPEEEVTTLEIASAKVPCSGFIKQECFQVRARSDAPWTLFYNQIEGFVYEPGYLYTIQVAIRVIPNPPLDGSSRAYRLLAILSKVSA